MNPTIIKTKKPNFIPGYVIGGPLFVIIVPLLFYFVSHKWWSISGKLITDVTIQFVIGSILLIIGMGFAAWSLMAQRRLGKGGPMEGLGVNISPKTQHLVITGPYRYTRNPMLFGTCVFYFALAAFFNSISFLVLAILFTVIMAPLIKLTEEKRLLKDFGGEYAEYKRKTSLFFPWPPRHS